MTDSADAPKRQTIDPWTVETADGGAVDYDKLVEDFGSERIDDELLGRFARVTGCEPHHWLRRKIFFSHRDLSDILDSYERGESFYLYTGRGPSSESLHFGHLIPFMFTAWLQKVFKCPLVIQLTDDEKYLFDSKDKFLSLEETQALGYENAKDILAVGFDPERTFLFSNVDYLGHLYPTIVAIQKKVNFNQAKGIFGFEGSANIGMISFPAIQAAPSFSSAFPIVLSKCRKKNSDLNFRVSGEWIAKDEFLKKKKVFKKALKEFETWFESEKKNPTQVPKCWYQSPDGGEIFFHENFEPPQAWKHRINPKWTVDPSDVSCLIPCAIDQDPYFRMTRDVASRLKLKKPALMHSKFFPALGGAHTKMSASLPSTCILLTDDRKSIRKKIMKNAFSGGGDTQEKQRAHGANLDIDIPYQWLRFFEPSDEILNDIAEKYSTGKMLTGEIKQILADLLADAAEKHQRERAKVTPGVLAHYMSIRPLEP